MIIWGACILGPTGFRHPFIDCLVNEGIIHHLLGSTARTAGNEKGRGGVFGRTTSLLFPKGKSVEHDVTGWLAERMAWEPSLQVSVAVTTP